MSEESKQAVLAAVIPFDRLSPLELEIVGAVLQENSYEPGAVIQLANHPLGRILIRTKGSWQSEHAELPNVIGVGALIGLEGRYPEIVAGDSGVECYALRKGHFFTIINECPEVLVRLLSASAEVAGPKRFL